MVAGRLQEKNGYYYMVIGYSEEKEKWISKWYATGLKVKGNKKKAEAMLLKVREHFTPGMQKDQVQQIISKHLQEQSENPVLDSNSDDSLFSTFMLDWLEMMRNSVELTTFATYQLLTKKQIVPYFFEMNIKLSDLQPKDIQGYYQYLFTTRHVCANTVIHHHAIIHKALKYARQTGLISSNPADLIQRPKKDKFIASFYDMDEANELLTICKGHKLEPAIVIGAYYGLRREEIIGLKWDAIDFQKKVFTIRHTVTDTYVDGKTLTIEKDRAKNKSSRRTLPLVPAVRTLLLKMRKQQEQYRIICGASYNTDYLDYVYVDEMGNRIKPNYVSTAFPRFLEQHGLRRIRFHDLRHSCASLLLANGVSMKEIQEWLGHSDFSTTANFYSHLDFSAKITASDKLCQVLQY